MDPAELPDVSSEVLACCQSLVMVDGELIGDPLEKAALQVGLASVCGGGVGGLGVSKECLAMVDELIGHPLEKAALQVMLCMMGGGVFVL